MYIVLSLYLIKDDFIAFPMSFLLCNNYLVNGCTGVFSFESYLEPMPSSVELSIKIDEHNSAIFKLVNYARLTGITVAHSVLQTE